ncbi:hypothetical protein AAFF_G00226740 [Aldrovandia affinis]|uniref:Uncharacterized protein n=1 Tax=Aldrovandia affinis TaxID=143900 RepID=A0AAD7TCV3_9TELE|nr:hypothetical protein AAFF_G00226740 [Aldrovandia affinis]
MSTNQLTSRTEVRAHTRYETERGAGIEPNASKLPAVTVSGDREESGTGASREKHCFYNLKRRRIRYGNPTPAISPWVRAGRRDADISYVAVTAVAVLLAGPELGLEPKGGCRVTNSSGWLDTMGISEPRHPSKQRTWHSSTHLATLAQGGIQSSTPGHTAAVTPQAPHQNLCGKRDMTHATPPGR